MALGGGPSVTLRFKGDADDLHRTIAGISAGLRGVSLAGVGMAGTVGVLGGLGAAASATVVAVSAIPAAFLGIGIAAAAQTDIVKNRFTQLKDHVMGEMVPLTASIQGELLIMADTVTAAFDRMEPQLLRIFKLSSQALAPLSDGLIALVENALPGFETAIQNSQPLVEAFGRGLGTLGTGVGGFFAALSEGTPGAIQGFDALMTLTKDLLIYLGQLVAQIANSLGPAFAALEPSLMQVVKALGDGLLRIIQTLAPYIGPLGKDIADFLTAALDALLPVVEAVVPLLAEMGHVLLESVTPIVRELGPVLAIVARELADGLRPVIPVVAQALRDMAPVMHDIAEQAGPLLAEIIRALAPLFLELVKGALELTNALLPVIPPLLEMANNAMPLVAGVINDVIIPAVRFLVTEFKGLIDYGVKLADGFGDLSVRWRTYWDEIKAAFADASAKITAGIEAFVSLPETARKHWDAMYQAIKTKIGEIVTEVQAFPPKVIAAVGDLAGALVEKGRAFIQGFLDGAKAVFQAVLDWVRNIPKMVLDAIGDTSRTLYNSGSSLIDGFNKGIESKVESARAAGIVAVDAASNPFPQSPAKEGPFSGQGWTLFRGQATIQGFIDGIMSKIPDLQSSITSIMNGVQSNLIVPIQSQLQNVWSQIQGLVSNLGGNLSNMGGANTSWLQAEDKSWVPSSFYGGAAGAAGSGKIELKVAPGADSALSSMLMNLVRTGQLQLQRAGIG